MELGINTSCSFVTPAPHKAHSSSSPLTPRQNYKRRETVACTHQVAPVVRTSGDFSATQARQHLHIQKLLFRVCCIQDDGVHQASSSTSTEPKWKQKLAAADDHAKRTRQKTLLVQEDYKQKQAAMHRLQGDTSKEVVPLKDLDFLPYLKEDGLIRDCSEPNAKASVYAIFDNDKALQYIGISRQVYSSMRLHFARMPLNCYYVKIQNISKPSRSLLELIRDKWIEENSTHPSGNDSGPEQNMWENPLDCKPLMTEEERKRLEEAGAGPPTAKVLKNVARRIEAELEKNFRARCCKDRLRFDPKLKDKGLLDLKNI